MRPDLSERLIRIGNRWLAPVFLVIALAGSVRASLDIINLPGGFSMTRILLISIPTTGGLASLVLIFLFVRGDHSKILRFNERLNGLTHDRRINVLLPVLWIIFYVLAFLPEDIGRWTAIYARLEPIFGFFFVIISITWLYWLFVSRQREITLVKEGKHAITAALTVFVIFVLTILVIFFTGMGIGPGTQFWGKAGVPILHWQIWIAGGMAVVWIFAQQKENRLAFILNKDFLVIGLFWIISFSIWQNIPLAVSRYSTAIYPPNFVSYPYSDAADYAGQAEAILVGRGFPYGFIDKPLHLVFLSFLGLLAGKDFGLMIGFQVAVLAIIPSLVYLLTSKIASRPSGIFAGILSLFMQANNLLLTNRIQMTNVKMAMSESLTCLMLLLVALAICSWWKNPKAGWGFPAMAGAVLGLASLVRLNVLVIAPFVFFTWLISSGVKNRKVWNSAVIFTVFCILPLVPWSIRTQVVLHNPIEFVKSKTEGVLLNERYRNLIDNKEDTPPIPTNNPSNGAVSTPKSKGITALIEPMVKSGFHNLVTVALVLPGSTAHSGLDETVRLPYWDQEWNGTFAPGGLLVLFLSLLVVVLGFAVVWKKYHVISLIPFLILFPYLLANTLSLVSGGRYIVPVDWVLPIYYAIGLTVAIDWLLQPVTATSRTFIPSTDMHRETRTGNFSIRIGLGVVLVISLLPMVLSFSIPERFSTVEPEQVLGEIRSLDITLPENISANDLEMFLSEKDSSFKYGRALFPRWMRSGEGDTAGAGSAFSTLPFDHLSFTILSDTAYPFDVVLPINQPVDFFPNATDSIIVGCKNKAYFDAILVILKTPNPVVYYRPDVTHLTCPLPPP